MMMMIIMSMSEMALIDYCLIRSVCSKMLNDVQQATKLCKTCSNHLGGQNKLTHKVVIFLLIRNNIPKHWTDLMKACCWPPNNNKKGAITNCSINWQIIINLPAFFIVVQRVSFLYDQMHFISIVRCYWWPICCWIQTEKKRLTDSSIQQQQQSWTFWMERIHWTSHCVCGDWVEWLVYTRQ